MLEKEKENIQKVYSYCKNYYINKKAFPPMHDIASHVQINKNDVGAILKLLVNHKYVKFINNRYYMAEQKVRRRPNKPKKEIIEKEKTSKITIFQRILIITQNIFNSIIFKCINLFTVIIGIYASIYFTTKWFMDYFTNTISIYLGLFIVFSSLVSFQNYKYTRKKRYFVLWIFVISFSIMTGISGQLNLQMDKKINNQNLNIESKKELLNSYKKRLNDIDIDIASSRKERAQLLIFLNDTKEINDKYKEINRKIDQKDAYLSSLKKEREKIETLNDNILKQNITSNLKEKIDFFDWLNNITKINADFLRFILYLLLALFADIIPPINLSILLFDIKKEN